MRFTHHIQHKKAATFRLRTLQHAFKSRCAGDAERNDDMLDEIGGVSPSQKMVPRHKIHAGLTASLRKNRSSKQQNDEKTPQTLVTFLAFVGEQMGGQNR
jgi:hypothetical protein